AIAAARRVPGNGAAAADEQLAGGDKDAAALAPAAARAAERLVIADRAAGDGERAKQRIDAAAEPVAASVALSLIAGHNHVRQVYVAAEIEKSTALRRFALRDGQPGHRHVYWAERGEYPARAAAVDGDHVRARAVHRETAEDVELSAREPDGACQSGGEVD